MFTMFKGERSTYKENRKGGYQYNKAGTLMRIHAIKLLPNTIISWNGFCVTHHTYGPLHLTGTQEAKTETLIEVYEINQGGNTSTTNKKAIVHPL